MNKTATPHTPHWSHEAHWPHEPHKAHKAHWHHIAIMALMAATLLACTDELYESDARHGAGSDDSDLIGFSISTSEINDVEPVNSSTRQLADSSTCQLADSSTRQLADHYAAHQLKGYNPWGLKAWRMPLPIMGIHPRTVKATAPTAAATRSHESEIATGSDFHDSLTIWGYTNTRPLFQQILLKRVRNWRTSVHWPYDNEKAEPSTSMRFYAVAPAMEGLNMSVPTSGYGAPSFTSQPVFTYTLPETAGEMRDLLYGESSIIDVQAGPTGTGKNPKAENLGQDNKLVDLNFNHILTAVRFAGSVPDGVILKQIIVRGAYTKATFDPTATDAATGTTGAWSNLQTTGSYTLWPGTVGTSGGTVYVNDSVLFMIPHTITENTQLELVIETAPIDTQFGTTPSRHVLSCSLQGDVWKKGYTVTYNFTVGQVEDGYYFVVGNPEETLTQVPHEGASGSFDVHSYHSYWDRTNSIQDKSRAVDWTVEGYYPDNNGSIDTSNKLASSSDWSTHYNSGKWIDVAGSSSGTNFVGGDNAVANYTVSAQAPWTSGNHATTLAQNTEAFTSGGTTSLSDSGTANCYIVNHEGTFTFPLVYGNKSADGNEAEGFVDHLGTRISYRNIHHQMTHLHNQTNVPLEDDAHRYQEQYSWETSGTTTVRAVVLWQDIQGLLSNPQVVTSEKIIQFEVSASVPGNGVIALQARTKRTYEKYDGSSWITDTSRGTNGYEYGNWETLWTWHIWMTDEAASTTTLGSTAMLPVNLGWVPDQKAFSTYKPRKVWVKLQQIEDGVVKNTAEVCFYQHARQPIVTGTSTVYQWGRPTALPAVCYVSLSPRTIYDGDNNPIAITIENNNTGEANEGITKPTALLRTSTDNGSNWAMATNDFWGSTKTVYDPCPPGYQLPAYSVFNTLSRTGATSAIGTSLNMWPDAGQSGKGAHFYTTAHGAWVSEEADASYRYDPTVYFPATGVYQAHNISHGTLMNSSSSVFTNTEGGALWTNTAGTDYAESLWFVPDWNRTESESTASGLPAIELPRTAIYRSSALPVRPVKQQ